MSLDRLKATLMLRLFGLLKIPMIAWLRPSMEELSEDHCAIRFPLRRRAKNHLGSMYFGALCVGADCAGGYIAMQEIRRSGHPISFVFKDFEAEFLKRAEGDVIFVCRDGALLKSLVARAAREGERVEDRVTVTATVPDKLGDTPVARFKLTISLKARS